MPGLITKYGAGKKCDLNIKANSFPSGVVTAGSIAESILGDLEFFVRTESGI